MKSLPLSLLLVGVCGGVFGCSGKPGRVHPPTYAEDAGVKALAAYDKDGDGSISGGEFDQVSGLRAGIKQVDTNGDGRISAQEIDGRVKVWLATRVGEMAVNCDVTLDEKPLAGAQILFEPEPFLGPKVISGTGETGEGGGANVSKAPEHLADPRYRGMACGWYKIRVTHPSKTIPSKYNTATILGCEVAMGAHWVNEGSIKLDLKSDAE